nr:phage tail length tape measure family protein [Sphingobium lignivorans]
MRSAEAATKAYDNSIEELKRELNPLIALEERYQAKLALLKKAYADGKLGAKELGDAERLLANERKRAEADIARNGRQGVTLFGLRPYELTNLSYQINDVVTQLASGTSLTQTLAQQGGQILQLFPRAGSAIAAAFSSKAFIGASVVIAGIALAIKGAADEAERLRTITGNLELDAAGGNYNATAISAVVDNMRSLGAYAKDAMAAVKTFTDEGLRQDRFDQFGQTAINMSRVLGIEVVDAAKQMAEAFSGGYDAIVKLDEATNFLTAQQRERIRTLFEEGDAERARAMALDLYTTKMDAVADKQRGSWEQSTQALNRGWQNLKDTIGDTAFIQGAYNALESLGNLLDRIANKLSSTRTVGVINQDIGDATAKLTRAQQELEKARTPLERSYYQQTIAQLDARILELTFERARAAARGGGGVTNESDADSRAAKARSDKLREINLERELEELRRKSDKERLSQSEKARREEIAGILAAKSAQDTQVAAALRRNAIEKEHAAILKDEEKVIKAGASAMKSAAAERERAIQQFNSRVVGAEGGTAKNPNSSAVGFGQFIDSTWLDQFKRVFSEQSKSMSDQQILALRNNQQVARAIIDNYARENARFLERFGQKVTAANLYLAHFLGAGDALKVLRADGDTPVDQILSRRVMQANRGYLYENGRARTADELERFIANRIGDTGAAQTAGQAEIERLTQEAAEAQERFNREIEKANDERERSIAALRTQNELQDSALIAAEKEIAVAKAEFDLRQRVADINTRLKPGQDAIQLTEAQIQRTRELAAAEFDLAKARDLAQAQTREVQAPIDRLTAERDALQARIDYLNENGLYDQARSLVPDLTATNSELRDAIAAAIEFYEALDLSNDALHRTPEEIRAIIERLKTANDETRQWVTVMGIGGKTIAQTFSGSAVSAIDSFAQAIAQGQNAFGALWSSFRQFAADFLLRIAQMIQQQLIFNLVSGLLGGLAGGLAGGAAGGGFGASNPFVPTSIAHSGGVVGHGLQQRMVAPQWFNNATRYHSGGIAGLAPDEVATILRKGEEVLTETDPRHRYNGGGSAGRPQDVTVINAFDAADMLVRALETREGTRAILNFVGSNARAFSQAMGG